MHDDTAVCDADSGRWDHSYVLRRLVNERDQHLINSINMLIIYSSSTSGLYSMFSLFVACSAISAMRISQNAQVKLKPTRVVGFWEQWWACLSCENEKLLIPSIQSSDLPHCQDGSQTGMLHSHSLGHRISSVNSLSQPFHPHTSPTQHMLIWMFHWSMCKPTQFTHA